MRGEHPGQGEGCTKVEDDIGTDGPVSGSHPCWLSSSSSPFLHLSLPIFPSSLYFTSVSLILLLLNS
ncbi:hypothetical protein CROQUDRAFT_360778 [Cronartium quercuum f. sp. fusiforme G11]|uniref:Uncharacterized protein n=1 Tax=Cronartium quercuum f. sp. fusiforme G11 TaxID=708437 RepID=A0A9P6NN79_9BASI|nr:hypothetical protein CROQUDRAFT_360778 [Cronartium quercuum f. sp. fusiforme G11]